MAAQISPPGFVPAIVGYENPQHFLQEQNQQPYTKIDIDVQELPTAPPPPPPPYYGPPPQGPQYYGQPYQQPPYGQPYPQQPYQQPGQPTYIYSYQQYPSDGGTYYVDRSTGYMYRSDPGGGYRGQQRDQRDRGGTSDAEAGCLGCLLGCLAVLCCCCLLGAGSD